MPFSGPVRAVIFDMDGVLCASEPFITEAAQRWFRERHGIEVPPEDFVPFVGTGEKRYVGGVAEKHGVAFDPEPDVRRVYEIYLEVIVGRLSPTPGLMDFIQACRDRGLPLAVATSAEPIKMEGNLREIGLPPESFDHVVTGSEVEHRKPAPDIFLLAADRLGVAPTDCLVVEDAVNGVQAARAANCRCLGLTTSFDDDTLRQAGADWTAPDFVHLPDDLMG